MTRLSVNEMTTFRWSFEQDVLNYSQAGIRSIGVWRQKLSDFGEERALELLHDCQMTVSNLLWAGGFTGSEGFSFREGLDDAADAVRQAAALGAECLVVYSGGRGGHTHNHARRLFREALAELVPLAAAQQVTLALEPMHAACAREWTFLHSLDDALQLVDDFQSPALKLAFDTYHLGHQPSVVSRLPSVAKQIAVVHLGDGACPSQPEQNRTRLGQGEVPLREIVQTLEAAGYDGHYDLELMGEAVESADYHELLADSKRAFERLFRSDPAYV